MNDISGPSGQSSSRSHDLQSCLESKLRALLHGSDLCEVIWKPWATPWGQSLSKPRARVRTTSETESGLWPTPRANKRGPPDSHGNLAMWATPRASDGEKGGPNMSFGAGGTPLPAQAARALWPTPVSHDDGKTPEAHLAMKQRMGERDGTNSNRTAITSLQVMAKATWPTPTSRDHKDGSYCPNVPVNGLLGWTVWDGPSGQMEKRGALNPEFVCWLMGYQPEHLSCAPTETRSTSGRPRRSSKPRSPAAPEEDLFG